MTTVLVTGANSGVGTATVAALLRRGALVIGTVRSDDAEREVRLFDPVAVASGRLQVAHLDVTDAAACEQVMEEHRPDVVVNNAGSALLGAVVDIDEERARSQFEALVLGPVRLARLLAAQQERGGSARVVNVSSVLSSAPVPFTGWYGAAKAALDSLSDTLRLELAPVGVDVVVVECGAVGTDVWDSASGDVVQGEDAATEEARERWAEVIDAVRPRFADPEEVGEAVADAALSESPNRTYRVGFGSHLGVLANVVPKAVQDAVTGMLFHLRRR